MIGNLWRKAHFVLASIVAIFLFLATISGAMLSLEPFYNQVNIPEESKIDKVNLADFLKSLNDNYVEVLEVNLVNDQLVKVNILDEENFEEKAFFVNPNNGLTLSYVYKQTPFFEFTTKFHRSLFLHTTGRIFLGICAFLLILIAITGVLLVMKKIGLKRFFLPIKKEAKLQYYHTYFGRISLIPILIMAITGTYLSLERFEIIDTKEKTTQEIPIDQNTEKKEVNKFQVFRNIPLSDVVKIEFPFSIAVKNLCMSAVLHSMLSMERMYKSK